MIVPVKVGQCPMTLNLDDEPLSGLRARCLRLLSSTDSSLIETRDYSRCHFAEDSPSSDSCTALNICRDSCRSSFFVPWYLI